MLNYGKKNLLGVKIDAVDYEYTLSRVLRAAQSKSRCTTTALAVHGVMTGVFEESHRYRLNALDLVVPDGMPVRWGLNWLYGCKLPDRVYGPTLMLKICEAASEQGLPIYLYGSDTETLEPLIQSLATRFPTLKIAGSEPSAFRQLSDSEARSVVNRIHRSGAKILFVGLGCPRQEVWAYEMGDELSMPVVAVGAAFAFHAGRIAQAPSWMQQRGLEWLFRLVMEPKRLWRRYALLNPSYLLLLVMQRLGLRKFDSDQLSKPTHRMQYG